MNNYAVNSTTSTSFVYWYDFHSKIKDSRKWMLYSDGGFVWWSWSPWSLQSSSDQNTLKPTAHRARTSYLRGAEGDHVHIKLITPVYRL